MVCLMRSLWPLANSTESKWMLVPKMKEFPQRVPEISGLQDTDHNNASGHGCTPVQRQKFVPFQSSHVLVLLQAGNHFSKGVLSYHVNLTASTMVMSVVDLNLRIWPISAAVFIHSHILCVSKGRNPHCGGRRSITVRTRSAALCVKRKVSVDPCWPSVYSTESGPISLGINAQHGTSIIPAVQRPSNSLSQSLPFTVPCPLSVSPWHSQKDSICPCPHSLFLCPSNCF